MSLVIPYIINMYRFGVLDQLGQLIILIYHICIFGVRDLLEINVVQSKKRFPVTAVTCFLDLWLDGVKKRDGPTTNEQGDSRSRIINRLIT